MCAWCSYLCTLCLMLPKAAVLGLMSPVKASQLPSYQLCSKLNHSHNPMHILWVQMPYRLLLLCHYIIVLTQDAFKTLRVEHIQGILCVACSSNVNGWLEMWGLHGASLTGTQCLPYLLRSNMSYVIVHTIYDYKYSFRFWNLLQYVIHTMYIF